MLIAALFIIAEILKAMFLFFNRRMAESQFSAANKQASQNSRDLRGKRYEEMEKEQSTN